MNTKSSFLSVGTALIVLCVSSLSVFAQKDVPRIQIQETAFRSDVLDDDPIISSDTLPQTSWYERAKTDWYDKNIKTVTISTAEELAGIAKLVSEGKFMKGFTFTLANDIDLKGYAWFPIGQKYRFPFQGTFDGAGYTIHNLYINSLVDAKTQGEGGQTLLEMYDGTGLFGKCEGANIKNLNVKTVRILSVSKDAATMCSNFYGSTMSNCAATDIKIQSAIKMEGGGMTVPVVSAFIGSGLYSTTIEDCVVSDADVFAIAQVAGLVAMPYANVNMNRCIVHNFRGRATVSQVGALCAASHPGPGATPINIRDCAVINAEVGASEMIGGLYGVGGPVNVTNTYSSTKVAVYEHEANRVFAGAVIGGRLMMDFGNLLYNADLNPNMPAEGKPKAAGEPASSLRGLEEPPMPRTEAELKSEATVVTLNAERLGNMAVWHIDPAKYNGFPFPSRPEVIVESTSSVWADQCVIQNTTNGWIVTGIRGKYRLFDLTGRMLMAGYLDDQVTIDASILTNGLYVLRIDTSDGVVIKKIIH